MHALKRTGYAIACGAVLTVSLSQLDPSRRIDAQRVEEQRQEQRIKDLSSQQSRIDRERRNKLPEAIDAENRERLRPAEHRPLPRLWFRW